MKTILICHKGNDLSEEGFARWMSSFSDLVGIIKIKEDGSRSKQRIKAEIKRSGMLRFVYFIWNVAHVMPTVSVYHFV